MIKFPEETSLVATKYPGYYFHKQNQCLYSCKRGVLRKRKPGKYWRALPPIFREVFWEVSHLGQRQYLFLYDLNAIEFGDHTFPIEL